MILSISGTDKLPGKSAGVSFIYLLASLFCILFGAVYELFSHGVYSFYMVYAFVFPLAGGTFPFLMISLFCAEWYPGKAAQNLYHAGLATFTVGSILQGILDIYGTSNNLIGCYWVFGLVLTAAGLAVCGFQLALRKK